MDRQKLIHQLFVGKVSDVLGMEKTTELLKEAKESFAIPNVVQQNEQCVKQEIDYKKEYNRICQEVAKMLVDNRKNYKTPMTSFELLSKWDKIREIK